MGSESDEDNDEQHDRKKLLGPKVLMNKQVPPNIVDLHVTKFSKVYIGDKYVTQNIYNSKTVNGQVLELKTVKLKRKTTVGAAVVATSSLILILFYFTSVKYPGRLDTGLNDKWYLRRWDWQALPEFTFEYLHLPVKCVIVGHTAERYCKEKFSCIKEMLEIQRNNLRRSWPDIGPNYLISGNGLIFEGRGANVLGTMVKSYDHKCISVMFLGNYERDPTVKEQFDHLKILLKQLVVLKVLDPKYFIIAHCQVDDSTVSPGLHVIESLRMFTHWDNITRWDNFNESLCLRPETEVAR